MVGNTGTLMTMRLVRSKLRKREESSTISAPGLEAQQTTFSLQTRSSQGDQQICATSSLDVVSNNSNVNNNNSDCEQVIFTRTSGIDPTTNGWCFPPKEPTPNIYSCMNNDVILGNFNEKNGFKGFRKQFSGRFKRLVARKSEPVHVIPPELKPQLKTIYVY